MAIEAHLEIRQQQGNRRDHPRRRLRLRIEGQKASGAAVDATVLNLSEHGLLLETTAEMAVDEAFEVDLPHVGLRSAVVVWTGHNVYGCRFVEAIGKAAVSAAQLQDEPTAASVSPDAEESFGTRLKRLRKARGFSLVAMARELGVSKPTVWYWEADQSRPRARSLTGLAALLDISVEQLVPAEWAVDLPATAPVPQAAFDEVVRTCRRQIAEAAGVTPDKVSISIDL